MIATLIVVLSTLAGTAVVAYVQHLTTIRTARVNESASGRVTDRTGAVCALIWWHFGR
ncbi:hypothetical protein OG864_24780 [Streptomyces sp. NBC_00124]|uniref:hypothetical protein n=1 Tax=Streptomyces sp. NBC_00124 TaxID=2975662 RepID=UPI00225A4E0D|nr:hypothetical protein [Streptomyces sp. NBC_00124]MCX5361927.1 hypothetical protein [Streptomyces sp. NBC_00124]